MSEVMVVPMAKTRMSNNPQRQGKGFGSFLKKGLAAVAPMAIDAGAKMIKDKYGFGIDLSQAQMRSLKKGGAIQIKPSQILEQGKQLLQLLPQSAKKLIGALKKNKGMRLMLKEGEDVVDKLTGGSIFGSIFKAVAPMLIDAGASFLGKKVRGGGGAGVMPAGTRGRGFGSFLKKGLSAVAPMAIDAGANLLKKKLSGGASPYVSGAYSEAMDRHSAGGGVYPAGRRGRGFGSFLKKGLSAVAPMAIDAGAKFLKGKLSGNGIYPAGRGMFPAGGAMPIQLGSPYQSVNSPAMNPFVGTTGLSGYAPITAGDRSGGAMMPMDGIMKASRRRMTGTNPATYTPSYISM